MILAYHRVSSNDVLDTIMAAGQIIPGAYRLDTSVIRDLCGELLQASFDLQAAEGRPVGEAMTQLVDEAAGEFEAVQAEFPGPKTQRTAFKCEDVLSGDAGRIFLSPGNWSEAGRGLGWPLSGFAFDAERMISLGARYRPRDILSSYWAVIRRTIEDPSMTSPEEIKARIVEGIREVQVNGELAGAAALTALEIYRLQPGDELKRPHERRKYEWHMGDEIIWDGPLPLDLAVEIRRNDEIIWSALTSIPVSPTLSGKPARKHRGRANQNPFDVAFKAFPACITGGLDQPKIVSDLVYQALHEIDMFEEGQDGAITARQAVIVREFIQKFRTTER